MIFPTYLSVRPSYYSSQYFCLFRCYYLVLQVNVPLCATSPFNYTSGPWVTSSGSLMISAILVMRVQQRLKVTWPWQHPLESPCPVTSTMCLFIFCSRAFFNSVGDYKNLLVPCTSSVQKLRVNIWQQTWVESRCLRITASHSVSHWVTILGNICMLLLVSSLPAVETLIMLPHIFFSFLVSHSSLLYSFILSIFFQDFCLSLCFQET